MRSKLPFQLSLLLDCFKKVLLYITLSVYVLFTFGAVFTATWWSLLNAIVCIIVFATYIVYEEARRGVE